MDATLVEASVIEASVVEASVIEAKLSSASARSIRDGLKAWWALDDRMPWDSWGNNHLRRGVTEASAGTGKDGFTSTEFNGPSVQDYLLDTQGELWNRLIGTGSFTLAFWAKNDNTTAVHRVIGTGNVGSANNPHGCFFNTDGSFNWDCYSSRRTTASVGTTWHHYVLHFNHLTTTATLYLDGVAQTPITNITVGDPSSHQFVIGAGTNLSSTLMHGEVCQVGLWGRPLSSDEVTTLYNSGTIPSVVTTRVLAGGHSFATIGTASNSATADTVNVRSTDNSDGDTGAANTSSVVHPFYLRDLPTSFFSGGDRAVLLTPFPSGNSDHENLSIVLNSSAAGTPFAGPWSNAANDANPLVPHPTGNFYQTDVWGLYDAVNNQVLMGYRIAATSNLNITNYHVTLPATGSEFTAGRSTGGGQELMLDIGTPTQVHRWPVSGDAGAAGGDTTSPSPVQLGDGSFRFYMTDDQNTPSKLVARDAASWTSTWGDAFDVPLYGLPQQKEPNHCEVWQQDGRYYILAMIDGEADTLGDLYFGVSEDGLAFFMTPHPVIARRAGDWDVSIYKTTGLITGGVSGTLHMLYSAYTTPTTGWGMADTSLSLP